MSLSAAVAEMTLMSSEVNGGRTVLVLREQHVDLKRNHI